MLLLDARSLVHVVSVERARLTLVLVGACCECVGADEGGFEGIRFEEACGGSSRIVKRGKGGF